MNLWVSNDITEKKIMLIEIINSDLKSGYKEKSPYDLIFIDCPVNNVSNEILDQLNLNLGRVITIEKINSDLGKGVRITKNKKNYNKEILFDAFSKLTLYRHKKEFIF